MHAYLNGTNNSNAIVIIGDVILDQRTHGVINRMSPEAPVPILNVENEVHLPGGAANVALNVSAISEEVVLITRFSNSKNSKNIIEPLGAQEIQIENIEDSYEPPVKRRLLVGNQQILRVDDEIVSGANNFAVVKLQKILESKLEEKSVIVVSDYGKGCITSETWQILLDESKKYENKIVVDPKNVNLNAYQGAYLIKPNFKEATEYAKASGKSFSTTLEMAKWIQKETKIEWVCITENAKGAVIVGPNENFHSYTPKRVPLVDVTGAGDSMLSILACGISMNLNPIELLEESCEIATWSCTFPGNKVFNLNEYRKWNESVV
jgi:D-beta-D-heptose 7-phosphate kinase/D-beta-D-heptose 1-phosphate adenosyltransferase